MAAFSGGVALSRCFYQEAVKPILDAAFPALAYAAALVGTGSEVLGYDTPLSADHDWGPRLLLFLAARERDALAPRIDALLEAQLPDTFQGYPTRFALSRDAESAPPRHRVEIHDVRRFAAARLGFDPDDEIRPADWLIVPEQALLELTAGAVYHDGPGELTALRARLAYYPRDVWLYLMAAQWRRIAQQEAFVGRTGDVGDELGSRLVATSIVRDLMRLCFFVERRYAPYAKWFGTAFARLACAPALGPLCAHVLQADGWQEREAALAAAYAAVVTLHNGLGVTPPLATAVSPYYNRPYLVVHADGVADALVAAIADPAVRRLPACGGVDQVSDSTDLLSYPQIRTKLRVLYE